MGEPYPLRPIGADEFETWARTIAFTYGEERRDCELALERAAIELDRTLAAVDGGTIVGGAAIFSRTMAVPGAAVPIARVSWVGVSPTHRRRGILTSMMRRQLTGLHESGGEAVAALNAADGGIYGRFGYGMALREARFSGDTPAMAFRPGVDLGAGRVVLLPREEARPVVERVFAAAWRDRVGWRERTAVWWDDRLHDDDHVRGNATALRFAVYRDVDGQATGYALLRLGGGVVHVVEVATTTRTAYAALWRFLIDIDGHPALRATGVPDEPLLHLLANPRAVQVSVVDDVWVRLVDVDRALAARGYAAPLDVVLAVDDVFCPWNTGRYRLTADAGGARCERTGAAPDLRLTAADLGAVYLGDTTFAVLAAAGRVDEVRPGALAVCTTAFRSAAPPC